MLLASISTSEAEPRVVSHGNGERWTLPQADSTMTDATIMESMTVRQKSARK